MQEDLTPKEKKELFKILKQEELERKAKELKGIFVMYGDNIRHIDVLKLNQYRYEDFLQTVHDMREEYLRIRRENGQNT